MLISRLLMLKQRCFTKLHTIFISRQIKPYKPHSPLSKQTYLQKLHIADRKRSKRVFNSVTDKRNLELFSWYTNEAAVMYQSL